jgi:hypothetical protein
MGTLSLCLLNFLSPITTTFEKWDFGKRSSGFVEFKAMHKSCQEAFYRKSVVELRATAQPARGNPRTQAAAMDCRARYARSQ